MRVRRWIAAGGGLVVAGALSVAVAARVLDGGDPEVVPWIGAPIGDDNLGRPVERNVPPIPRGARGCEAPRVRLALEGPNPVNSLVTAYGVGLENRGAATCTLRGLPSVVVEQRGGGPLRIAEAAAGEAFAAGYPPAGPAFGLAPRREAWAALMLSEDCSRPGIRLRQAVVRVGLPGAEPLRLTFPSCSSGATLSVSPWQPPSRPEPPPVRFPFAAELALPETAVAGRPVDFRVRLRNTSREPFRFPYCPLYAAGIDGGDGNVGPLNCAPVGRVDPGGAVVFAMRVDVSRHFAAGRHRLGWYLIGETGDRTVSATGSIEIRRV